MTALAVVVGILALGVGAALLFAPERPAAPPVSAISYAPLPEDQVPRARVSHDSPRSRQQTRVAQASEATPDASAEDLASQVVLVGTVREAENGEPVFDASVTIVFQMSEAERAELVRATESSDAAVAEEAKQRITNEERPRRTAHTSRDGRYRLGIARPGNYLVTVSCPNFVKEEPIPVAIAEGEREKQLDFTLSRGASVSGHVLERQTKRPAVGVVVRGYADNFTGRAETRTDDRGAYTLSGFGPGAGTVSIELRDAPYLASNHLPSQPITIVSPNQRLTGIDFFVEPAGLVWGYVMDYEKRPVTSEVLLCSSESVVTQAVNIAIKQAPPISDHSDETGIYQLFGVPLNKEWRVYTFGDGTGAPQLSDPFLLTDAQRTVRVDLYTPRGSTIFGVTVSADGSVVEGAEMACMPSFGSIAGPMDRAKAFKDTRSDGTGNFSFPGVPAGSYQILAHKEGFRMDITGEPVYPDGHSDIGPMRVVLTPVESGRYSVYGYVTDAANNAIADARLHLGGMSGGAIIGNDSGVRSDARGYFVFYGVDPGYYVLTCEKEGYAEQVVREVKLDEPITIVMQATGHVSGRVLIAETNAPPTSFSVRASLIGGGPGGLLGMAMEVEGRHLDTDPATGAFSGPLPAGAYALKARANGLAPGRTEITVREGESVDGITIYVSEQGSVIEGRVVVADGSSAASAQVLIAGGGAGLASFVDLADPDSRNVARVGQDGAFRFDRLAAGTYQVVARLASYAQAHSEMITVGERQRVSGVQLVLGHGGTFEGYVMADGGMLVGAAVTVSGNGYTNVTSTDQNGFYRMEGIPTGTYMAMAAKVEGITTGQFSPMHATVQIGEGQTTLHNFGEETGVDVLGYVNPAPATGTMAYAMVTLPGVGDLAGLELNSPASWFGGTSSAGMYLIDVKPVDSGGYFRLNVPPGDYELHIVSMSMGQLLAGDVRPVYSRPLGVTGNAPIQLDINLTQQ